MSALGSARFIGRRAGYALLVMLLTSVVTFLALRTTPGNVASSVLNPATTPPDVIAQLRHDLGLDDPIWRQYVDYMSGLFRGDLGFSLTNRIPVTTLISNSATYTVVLAAAAFGVAFGIGVPMGVLAALNQGRWFDRAVRMGASFVQAIPNFVLALVFVLVFATRLRWFPVSGAATASSLVLPALVLAAEPGALTTRVTRTAMLEQLAADYTRTLRARGVARGRINWLHVLRNSLSPIISLGAVQIRTLLGYTLIVEVIFRWPGLGSQLVQSVLDRDYPVAQTLALLLAAVVVFANMLSDVAYGWADPRIRVDAAIAR